MKTEWNLGWNSPVIRWAYFPVNDCYSPPPMTSLCALFWRTVLLTPLKIALLGAGLGLFLFFLEHLLFHMDMGLWTAFALPMGGNYGWAY